MIEGQFESHSGHQHFLTAQRASLLQRHPIVTPLLLLASSIALCIASVFANTLFPVLAIFDLPAMLMCLLFALVLGIAGILAGIISIIERLDRSYARSSMFPQAKEGTS